MLPRRLSKAAGGCAVLFLIPLLGCSIHPLPGDIPRVATIDIVERMRCEAQEGLREFNLKDPMIASILESATIGYDFDFDITEENNEGTKDDPGSLTLKRQGRGDDLFTLGLSASSAKKRENRRRFHIIEELKALNKINCSPQVTQANWIYPITGATGISEVVRTFIKLEKLADLQLDTPSSATIATTGPDYVNVVFSDVLRFTTNLTASATPTLKLTAAVGSLRVTNASITGQAIRNDVHTVIVAIARDPKVQIIRDREGRVTRRIVTPPARVTFAKAKRELLVKQGVVRDSRIVTALIQKDADAHNRVLIELQRLRDLEDDEREAPRLLGERLLEIMRQTP
jgi:hypothetical protein